MGDPYYNKSYAIKASETSIGNMVGVRLTGFEILRTDDSKPRLMCSNDNEDMIVFYAEGGRTFIMTHASECDETVNLEDICGDLQDLVGHPILTAEEVKNEKTSLNDKGPTWTFYKLATIKGSVTIRWYGTGNGWYSEDANLYDVYEPSQEELKKKFADSSPP